MSRTIGDAEAKLSKLGGIAGVVSPEPEVKSFHISEENDFLVLGCDGIFDQLNNEEVAEAVWLAATGSFKEQSVHKQSGLSVDMIIKASMVRKSLDNVTVVFIAFSNFEKALADPMEMADKYQRILTEPQAQSSLETLAKRVDNLSLTSLSSSANSKGTIKKLKIRSSPGKLKLSKQLRKTKINFPLLKKRTTKNLSLKMK